MSVHEAENENGTITCARQLAATISAPCFIALYGDLGAGKSVFARAVIRALIGDETEDVPSPTFTLVQHYESDKGPVNHFDLYRLEHVADIDELGWDDAVFDSICLVEWPQRAGGLLPDDRIDIDLKITAPQKRTITITTQGKAAQYEQ